MSKKKNTVDYTVWFTVDKGGIIGVDRKEISIEDKSSYMSWLKTLNHLPTENEVKQFEQSLAG